MVKDAAAGKCGGSAADMGFYELLDLAQQVRASPPALPLHHRCLEWLSFYSSTPPHCHVNSLADSRSPVDRELIEL